MTRPRDVQTRVLLSPPRVRGTVTGALVGSGVAVVYVALDRTMTSPDGGWVGPILTGVIVGLVLAVVTGGLATWSAQDLDRRPEVTLLTPGQRAAVILAARRGPVPDDPTVRSAALRMVGTDVARARRDRRRGGTVLLALAVAMTVFTILHPSTLQWLSTVALVAPAAEMLLRPRLLTRRRDLLAGSPGP